MLEETNYLAPNLAPGAIVFLVIPLLMLCAAYWIIRLAVRHGVTDALRANRDWLRPDRSSTADRA